MIDNSLLLGDLEPRGLWFILKKLQKEFARSNQATKTN